MKHNDFSWNKLYSHHFVLVLFTSWSNHYQVLIWKNKLSVPVKMIRWIVQYYNSNSKDMYVLYNIIIVIKDLYMSFYHCWIILVRKTRHQTSETFLYHSVLDNNSKPDICLFDHTVVPSKTLQSYHGKCIRACYTHSSSLQSRVKAS